MEAELRHEINDIKKLLKELVREKRKEENQDSWMTSEQVLKVYGLKEETLRKYRRVGTLKNWKRLRSSGRKVLYNREELEELFTP